MLIKSQFPPNIARSSRYQLASQAVKHPLGCADFRVGDAERRRLQTEHLMCRVECS